MKIVFFGDSLIQGAYGRNIVNKIAPQLPGHHFVNMGVNGDTSLNLYKRLDRDVIDEKPGGVFIMIGINDAVSYAEPGLRLYFRFIKGVRGGQISPISFRENMRAIFTKLRVARIKAWVALPPLETSPVVVDALRQMNAFTAELCQEMEIPLLDLMAEFTPAQLATRPPLRLVPSMWQNMRRSLTLSGDAYDKLRQAEGYSYSFDGTHLTETSAQQFADRIAVFLREQGL